VLAGLGVVIIKRAEKAVSLRKVAHRVEELHSALDPIARRRRTTAVLHTDSGVIVGSGTRDLDRAQQMLLRKGEIAAKRPGAHAEITVLAEAQRRRARPIAIATSWDMCANCQKSLEEAGAIILDPRTAIWP
jgi:hypothetical protein